MADLPPRTSSTSKLAARRHTVADMEATSFVSGADAAPLMMTQQGRNTHQHEDDNHDQFQQRFRFQSP